ncbi:MULTISPECIES: hypothetical protein, partial [unclassified Acinetobacter]|uniref:hypothetical protein n=1 Tax=unclassified Acinetobacter TaxID=196816 RepID=UPI002575330D
SKLISNVLEAAQILPSISFNTAIDTAIKKTKQTIKYKQSPTQKAQQPKAVSYRGLCCTNLFMTAYSAKPIF